MTGIPCEVGQVYASANKRDIANNHNQSRKVLRIEHGTTGYAEKRRPARFAVLSGDAYGGGSTGTCRLAPDGSLPRHALVAPADPHTLALAQCFEGIESGRYWYPGDDGKVDVQEKALEVLLRPQSDGSQRVSINQLLTLDANAVRAIGERILTLVQVVEQNAISTFESPAQPALAALDALTASVDALQAKVSGDAEWMGEWNDEPHTTETMEP